MKNLLSRIAKVVGIIIVVLVGISLIGLLVSSIVYPWEYVSRLLTMRQSDVDDYRYNFPQRRLAAAAEPQPFEENLDMERVAAVFEQQPEIDDLEGFLTESDTEAFIVIQDGALVYENYFNGAERDTPMTSFSTAKSFTSALIGKAIEEGYIADVNDPITNYLPELAERDPRFAQITVRHLLLMASGMEYEEMRPFLFNGDDPLTTYYPDQREISLQNTTIVDPPGAYFLYNKYHPQLLGMILERATGMPVSEYTQRTLWEPLGMEYDGGWSLDSEESGFEKMEAGLNARAIDFAKFGQLFLDGGNWDGEQVLASEWVAGSIQFDPDLHNETYYAHSWGPEVYDEGQGYYKYMWYGFFREDGRYDFSALGDHGQIIYVSPDKNLVIVRNGDTYGLPGSAFGWTDILYQFASDYW